MKPGSGNNIRAEIGEVFSVFRYLPRDQIEEFAFPSDDEAAERVRLFLAQVGSVFVPDQGLQIVRIDGEFFRYGASAVF